jgi:hypothetical protein
MWQQEYRNKELNNGRLAMIAAAGITYVTHPYTFFSSLTAFPPHLSPASSNKQRTGC